MGENWLEALRNSDFGKAIRQQCDEAEDVPAERSGDGWKGSIYGFCPVQGHGSVDNLFWYFRSRHEEWRLEVYRTSCDAELPPDEQIVWSASGEYEGDQPNAGWMKFSEAWDIIEESIALGRETGWAMPSPSPGPEEK